MHTYVRHGRHKISAEMREPSQDELDEGIGDGAEEARCELNHGGALPSTWPAFQA